MIWHRGVQWVPWVSCNSSWGMDISPLQYLPYNKRKALHTLRRVKVTVSDKKSIHIMRVPFIAELLYLQVNWFKNREEMLGVLPQVEEAVGGYLALQELLYQGEKLQSKLLEEVTFLEGAENRADHLIVSLEQRCRGHMPFYFLFSNTVVF